jgi:hypothetical protein
MSKQNVDLVRSLIPRTDTDIAALYRDESLFEAASEAIQSLLDPGFECVAVFQGGRTYAGTEGFRRLWLDWLEPWATYRVQVDEIIDMGDRVVVLVRDRARRHDVDAEVELISGSVWDFRGGRLLRVRFCSDRKEVFEVAGLPEQDLDTGR